MEGRIYFLHVLRGIAAIMVVYTHFSLIHNKPFFLSFFHNNIVRPINFLNLHLAASGVLLFFLISGFVISISINKTTPSQFIIHRCFRIFPVLWVVLVSILLEKVFFYKVGYIDNIGITPLNFVTNALLLKDFAWENSIEAGVWTLLIEMKFYVLVALVYYFNLKENINEKTFFKIAVCIFAIGITFISKKAVLVNELLEHDFNLFVLARVLSDIAPFMICIFCGVSSYYYYINKINLFSHVCYTVVYYIMYSFLLLSGSSSKAICSTYREDCFWVLFIFNILCVYFKHKSTATKKSSNSILNFLANISYPLYLFHGYFAMSLIDYIDAFINNINISILIVLPFLLYICFITHKFIEIPFSKLGKRFCSLSFSAQESNPHKKSLANTHTYMAQQ